MLLQAQHGGQAREGVEDILDEADDGGDVEGAGEAGDGVEQAVHGGDERGEVGVDVDGGGLSLGQAREVAQVEPAELREHVVQCRGDGAERALDVADRAGHEPVD